MEGTVFTNDLFKGAYNVILKCRIKIFKHQAERFIVKNKLECKFFKDNSA